MDVFSLARHLAEDHGPSDDSYDLCSSDANAAHYDFHAKAGGNHQHEWDGWIADPQGPIQERP